MADESGAAGLAKGITKSLRAQMWTGADWSPVGRLLAEWQAEVIRGVPHTCAYCRTTITIHVTRALVDGPAAEDMEPHVTVMESRNK